MSQTAKLKVEAVSGLTAEDIRCLCCHRSFCHFSADHPPRIPENIKGNPQVWMAHADGRIVGFVVTWEVSQETAHICEPRVHEQFEGQEIAKDLVRKALENATVDGCVKFVLHDVEASKETMEVMKRGFTFSRKRACAGEVWLEFYLDLYKKVAPTDSQENQGDEAMTKMASRKP